MSYGTYLIRSRHQTNWYARIVVPHDVRHHFRQRREIRKTLGTSCKATAKRRAMAIWLAYQDVFNALRNGLPVEDLNPDWGALAGITTAIQPQRATPPRFIDRDFTFTLIEPITGYRESDGSPVTVQYVTFDAITGMPIIKDELPDDTIRIAKELMTHHRELFGKPAQAFAPAEPPPEPMLSELFEAFIAKAQRDSREKTRLSMRQSFNVFLELVDDMLVSELSKDIACDFGDRLAEYPVSRAKGRWAKMTLDELHSAGRPCISSTTFNNHLRRLSTFGRWLSKIGKLPNDPFDAITKAKKSDGPRKIRSWSDDELRLWFRSEEYLQHSNSAKTAWKFWLPLIALYSGARLEELAALAPTDFGTFNGVLAYRIHAEDGRFVKNENAWRHVPIHSHLVQLGFMRYVKQRKGCERLFTLTCYQGQWGKYASTRLGEMRQLLGIKPTFHGYRNTVITRLFEHAEQIQFVPLITGQGMSGEAWQYLMKSDKSVLLPKLSELVETLDWSHIIDIPRST